MLSTNYLHRNSADRTVKNNFSESSSIIWGSWIKFFLNSGFGFIRRGTCFGWFWADLKYQCHHLDCTYTSVFTQCHNELIYLFWVLSKIKLFSFCRHLPEKVKDDQQLKNMSGQWFYEAKAKRHRDRIHGTDIIRASMRKKRLQVAGE